MAGLVLAQSSLVHPRFPKLSAHFTPSTSLFLQYRHLNTHRKPLVFTCRVVSKSPSNTSDNVDLTSEIEGGGGSEDFRSGQGEGGGGGGGGDRSGGGGDEGEEEGGSKKKMSMSQKLTLAYAALVGMGGAMGYMKSGSSKSLLSGGISAAFLYYVYTQLPTNPVYASSIGLGVSAVLAGVMLSRFIRSKKIFPAGVVSAVSLIMTGGYIHGILRTAH